MFPFFWLRDSIVVLSQDSKSLLCRLVANLGGKLHSAPCSRVLWELVYHSLVPYWGHGHCRKLRCPWRQNEQIWAATVFCTIASVHFPGSRTLALWLLVSFAEVTIWRNTNGYTFSAALFRWLNSVTDGKNLEPSFVLVAFGVLLSSKTTFPLDLCTPSLPLAWSFNQSLKSFKVGLLQLQRAGCFDHVNFILRRRFSMAWSRGEALDKSGFWINEPKY